ncbi:Meiotic Sister-Chromatid recombination aldehyde dehydrogenase, partial [Dipsacomyces acuminosporus]
MDCALKLVAHEAFPVIIAVVAGSVVLYYLFIRKSSLPAIPFELRPLPESLPSWRGSEVLDKPSIFVDGHPELIQCFDPATGRSLGQVRATTVEELNDKLHRARKAQ